MNNSIPLRRWDTKCWCWSWGRSLNTYACTYKRVLDRYIENKHKIRYNKVIYKKIRYDRIHTHTYTDTYKVQHEMVRIKGGIVHSFIRMYVRTYLHHESPFNTVDRITNSARNRRYNLLLFCYHCYHFQYHHEWCVIMHYFSVVIITYINSKHFPDM